jgi:hypothetical protein
LIFLISFDLFNPKHVSKFLLEKKQKRLNHQTARTAGLPVFSRFDAGSPFHWFPCGSVFRPNRTGYTSGSRFDRPVQF